MKQEIIHYKNFLECIAIGYLCNYHYLNQFSFRRNALLDEMGLYEMAINQKKG